MISDNDPAAIAPANDFSESDRDAGWRWTAWIRTGKTSWRRLSSRFWRVPAEVKNHRYAICRQCEHFVPATTQCRRCYCAMGIKAWYAELSCPEGKWDAVQPPPGPEEG